MSATSAVIRITTLQARPGARDALVVAAWQNALAARTQDGCLSAEVAADPADPDRVLVVSRWTSESAVQSFLRWHETIAHAGLRDHTVDAPTSAHHAVDAAAAFVADWQTWHDAHERRRAAPDGFLAITGAHWLTAEPTRFDDVPGAWSVAAAGVAVVLDDGEALRIGGDDVTGVHSFGAVIEGAPRWATWQTDAGTAHVEVASFDGRVVVRPRHSDSPTLRAYTGTPAYAPDPRYVVEGVLTPFIDGRRRTVPTVVADISTTFDAPGSIAFDLDGARALTAFADGDGLRVLFTDRTSGVTTFGASRDLRVDAPDADGRVRLDFNRAVNLPCAYSSSVVCPLPPAENRLDVAVEAGEKSPH